MLGARIAALRRDKGWSQAELAGFLGISASAVGMYEQGRREPSAALLVALARSFEVTTDFLLTGLPGRPEDGETTIRLLEQSLEAAEAALARRRDRPFTRRELATLLAAMLMD
jgi:transcriptional regulator with XRE-family HTH domain